MTHFKSIFIATLLILPAISYALTDAEELSLRKPQAPYIQGDVLYVRGPIDSNLYNAMAYDYVAMKNVRVVDLSSFGGQPQWAMEAARKIRELGLNTRIATGQICASACVPLFVAGNRRVMAVDANIGLHAVRLKVGPATTFEGLCFSELEDGSHEFDERRAGCRKFLQEYIPLAARETEMIFDFAETGGVSPSLRSDYAAMPDDPNWFERYNVTKRPDWLIDIATAIKYRLATDVETKTHPRVLFY